MKSLALFLFVAFTISSTQLVAEDKLAEQLQGEWQIVSIETAGRKVTADQVGDLMLKLSDGKMTAMKGDNVQTVAKFQLDAKAKPAAIDFEVIEGRDVGKQNKGIVRIKEGQLQLCMEATKDGARPKAFKVEADSRQILMTLKRKK